MIIIKYTGLDACQAIKVSLLPNYTFGGTQDGDSNEGKEKGKKG